MCSPKGCVLVGTVIWTDQGKFGAFGRACGLVRQPRNSGLNHRIIGRQHVCLGHRKGHIGRNACTFVLGTLPAMFPIGSPGLIIDTADPVKYEAAKSNRHSDHPAER